MVSGKLCLRWDLTLSCWLYYLAVSQFRIYASSIPLYNPSQWNICHGFYIGTERTNKRTCMNGRTERTTHLIRWLCAFFYFLFCSLSLALKTLCKVRKLLIERSVYTHRGTRMQKVKSNDSKSSKACCLCHTERQIYTVYCKVK